MSKLGDAGKWILTTIITMLGGGFAAAVPVMTDPAKYKFPQDIGSGKLWPYIFTGWALTLGGILIHSPLGQKAITFANQSKAQLAQSQKDLDQAKSDLTAKSDKP
jgi:hypothetical protein